jgi:hypothetical protein
MDNYHCIDLTGTDVLDLLATLEENGAILFSWSPDKITAYIVLIVREYFQVGSLPWGGKPNGAYLVSVKGHGGIFYWDYGQEVHANYVGEKLRLGPGDAKAITHLLNTLSLTPQPKGN